jgi:hypothetical protein
VVCQDKRMSFVNPGDVAATGETMTDPCVAFDCGEFGDCKSINMTPTCLCDQGYVAVGSMDATGARSTRCEKPMIAIPSLFYAQRLPDLPSELPGGTKVVITTPPAMQMPVIQPRMTDLGSNSGAMPIPARTTPADTSNDCHVRAPGARTGSGATTLLFVALAWLGWRRRRA